MSGWWPSQARLGGLRWPAVRRLLQSRRAGLAALAIAAALFATETTRAVLAFSREYRQVASATPAQMDRAPRATREGHAGADLAGTDLAGADLAGADLAEADLASVSTILKSLPAEEQPGPMLSDLLRILQEAGIDTYRYRLLLAGAAGSGEAGEAGEMDAGGLEDRPVFDLLPLGENDPWIGEELEPLDLSRAELPPPPPGVRKWELALYVQASYARLLHALRLLETDERLWDVPRLAVRRGPAGTEADLRLLTYTSEPGTGSGEADFAVPAPSSPSILARDPFGAGEARTGGSGSRRPPRLGGVRVGAGEAAWLDGQPVRPGERIGDWTLLSVSASEVWVQHQYGRKVRIPLEEPPGKEASDVRP